MYQKLQERKRKVCLTITKVAHKFSTFPRSNTQSPTHNFKPSQKENKMTTMMMMPLHNVSMNDRNTIGAHALNSNSSDDIRIQSNAPPARVSVSESISTTLNCTGISSGRKTKTALPADWTPSPYSVVMGRGRVNDHTGNRRLKILCNLNLPAFQAAKSRREKSYVVARVLETVRSACGGVGAFIRKESNVWYEVDESMAREKVGVVMRDLSPAGQYRSSTKNKVARRRQRKEERNSHQSMNKSIMPQPDSSLSQTSATAQHQTTASRNLSIVNFDFSSIQQEQQNQNNSDHENDYVSLSDDDFAAAFQ